MSLEKAVFFAWVADEKSGYLLGAHGDIAKSEIDYVVPGIEDTLVEPPPGPGIWVWEGEAEYSPGGEYPGDCEPQYDGEWRRADPHELAQLARGELPPMREFPARPWWMGMEGAESWEEDTGG